MPKSKSKRKPAAKKGVQAAGVGVGTLPPQPVSGKVGMQFVSAQSRKECTSVAVAGAIYKRDQNGRFMVAAEHAPALLNAGLRYC